MPIEVPVAALPRPSSGNGGGEAATISITDPTNAYISITGDGTGPIKYSTAGSVYPTVLDAGLSVPSSGNDGLFLLNGTSTVEASLDAVTDPNTLGTLKCGVVDCTSLKIGGTDFPANAASNSNQQILPADPQKGDMLFWNENEWSLVTSESVNDGALLTLRSGVPVWENSDMVRMVGTGSQVVELSAKDAILKANAKAMMDQANNSQNGILGLLNG